jgi:hypothetical protein
MSSSNNTKLAWVSGTALVAMIAAAVVLSQQAAPATNDWTASSSLINDDASLPPLFPLQPTAYLGLGCAIVGLILAAGGGIGGGGR